jgi:hypothetical protein
MIIKFLYKMKCEDIFTVTKAKFLPNTKLTA